MNQSKNVQRNRQFGPKEMRKTLEQKLRHTISDSIRGQYDYETQERDPRSGRHWVQKQAIRIDGINGIALVDAYEYFDSRFVQLKPETVIEMVENKHGLFVTTDPLHDDEFCPEFVTHQVTEFVTLDRLKHQIAEMFNLSFFMCWDKENFASHIGPHCHVEPLRKEASRLGKGYLYYKIGTEKEMRRILRSGLKMNHQTTTTSHRLSESERDICAGKAMQAIKEFVRDVFDSALRWGVASPQTEETVSETADESPDLLSLEENRKMNMTDPETPETVNEESEMPEMESEVETMLEMDGTEVEEENAVMA